jgi:hypothetical protein
MSAPLTKSQKRYLAQLSDRAFNLLAAQARARGEDPASSIGAALSNQLTNVGSTLSALLPSAICHLPFAELSATDQRRAFRHAHVALAASRVGLTRAVALRSGRDILSLRPRTTDLYHLGLVELIGSQAGEGLYRARTRGEWEQWNASQPSAITTQQNLI